MQHVTYLIMTNCTGKGTCFTQMISYCKLVLHGLSISDCVRECQLRPECLSVDYKKYLHKCEINDISAQPDLSFNTRVVFTKRPDWKEVS